MRMYFAAPSSSSRVRSLLAYASAAVVSGAEGEGV